MEQSWDREGRVVHTQMNWTGNATNYELPFGGHCDVPPDLPPKISFPVIWECRWPIAFTVREVTKAIQVLCHLQSHLAQSHNPSWGSPYKIAGQWRNIKIWPCPPNLGLLQKAILASEVPMSFAGTSLSPASQLNLSPTRLLLPSDYFQRC